ncbi:argininosuccinate lyase [Methanofollis aquaemaris]|uniref:Argininosuccinate lyase n=1 Tax=Methanofollis aquaemaris TaxID=126734 RepID=A0A8A3S7K1_9EURY|nr:argininosuccinate lyase [Methanofollis aquaemaris]QSZ68118.1 argininosuccinate lyase [Methanofollis aquaemaris]
MHRDLLRRGRLSDDRTGEVMHFLSSMTADHWIAGMDIQVDMAHLLMLREREIIGEDAARALMGALLAFHEDGIPDEAYDECFEDIHAGKEAALIARVGEEFGGRLHMGRSRNDEVATCIRMRLREELLGCIAAVCDLRRVLLDLAEAHRETIMPGFTHLQHAQPTTLAHHLLAYEAAFGRDFGRLADAYGRVNECPLGAAAFASTGYPIDREMTARLLGFERPMGNSMDAVATRDFALESLSACAVMMTTASRLCEEMVVWSSAFVRFVQLADGYSSTSSIMPQKKNPDTAEIMRAKAGTVAGSLAGAMTITKGLPMSYNRDLQELTPHLWRGVAAARESLVVLAGMLSTATFDTDRMAAESDRGFSTATELADVLVREYGLPFRTAHSVVGRAVKQGALDLATLEAAAEEVAGLSLTERGLTPERVAAALDPAISVAERKAIGGPAPDETARAVAARNKDLAADEAATAGLAKAIETALARLVEEARRLAEA